MQTLFQRILGSKTSIIWLVILGVIPLLSIFGRPLQQFVQGKISSAQLATLFVLCSIALLGGLAGYAKGSTKRQLIFHLVWAAVVFLAIPLLLETVVERLHFIVFGVFGFLSVANFNLRSAVVICALVGGLDELLQWFLPDRVGDWRDVGFNWVACAGGCLLAGFLPENNTEPKEQGMQ